MKQKLVIGFKIDGITKLDIEMSLQIGHDALSLLLKDLDLSLEFCFLVLQKH